MLWGPNSGDAQHTTTTVYDAVGRVKSVTDPLGRQTQYVYDNLGRKIETIAPDPGTGSPTTLYGYDLDSNLISTTDPLGHTTSYHCDAFNRQTQVIDALGNTATTQYDVVGDVTATTDPLGRTTTYQYNRLGQKVFQSQPNPAGRSLARHDVLLRRRGQSRVHYRSIGAHHLVEIRRPGPPDPQRGCPGQRPRQHHGQQTVTVYDNAGNVSTVTDPDGNVTSYVYDNTNRVIVETTPTQSGNVVAGNNGQRLSSTFQYDAVGNLVQKTDTLGRVTTYAYNADNCQIEEDDGTYVIKKFYDAAGQLYGVQDPGATYYYQYDQDGRVVRSRMAPGDMPQTGSLTWSPVNGTLNNTASTYTYTLSDLLDLGTTFSATVTSPGSSGNSQFHPYLKLVSPAGQIVAVADSGSGYSATLQIPLARRARHRPLVCRSDRQPGLRAIERQLWLHAQPLGDRVRVVDGRELRLQRRRQPKVGHGYGGRRNRLSVQRRRKRHATEANDRLHDSERTGEPDLLR